jgi:AcrR family transcriptional regulator
MVVEPLRDRRAERREATTAEILEAAWELVREQGLAALSLRDLARKVGMRPPSLYWYFESKHAIYDAMFAEGNRELLRRMADRQWPDELDAMLRAVGTLFVQFSVEDPARYQLLFQRTIPGFAPSTDSYALAVQVFDQGRALLASVGLSDMADVDLWTAIVAGLSAQQVANDPGDDRWVGRVDDAVDMYALYVINKPTPRRRR